MSKLIPIFHGSSGINNKLDPVRLKFNSKTGISDLAAGVNITIDDTGRPSRRIGYTATDRTESFHSLFSCGSYALGVTGNALAVIEADMSYTSIRNVTQNLRMSYVRDTDGTKDVIYYTNGVEQGRVLNKLSYSWTAGDYVGATSRKEIYDPPIGHLLEIRNLRMFISEGNILWYSEPGSLSQFRLASNYFGFPSRIKMIQAVDGGLWISDSENVYFLGGEIAPTLQEMPVQVKKCDCPVIEGTAVEAPASRIGIEGLSGIVTIFTTTRGVSVGSGDGQLIPVSEHKIEIPSGLTGSAVYRDGHYILTID